MALGGLTLFLVRRRRRGFAGEDEAADTVALADLSPEALADRRVFLERSLADAKAEHDAGDLSDADYDALSRRDGSRLEAMEAIEAGLVSLGAAVTARPLQTRSWQSTRGSSLEATVTHLLEDTDTDTPNTDTDHERHDRTRSTVSPGAKPGDRFVQRRGAAVDSRFLMGGAVTALAAAVVLAVVLIAVPRLPGQTETGNVTSASNKRWPRRWLRRPPPRMPDSSARPRSSTTRSSARIRTRPRPQPSWVGSTTRWDPRARAPR